MNDYALDKKLKSEYIFYVFALSIVDSLSKKIGKRPNNMNRPRMLLNKGKDTAFGSTE